MRPTGWFQVGWSSDLEVGDVKPLYYFGADLVAFRDLDEAVRVLDAHCQHMGADMSRGGCVVEGGIQCPFHGWVWNGDGCNVHIPYESRPDDSRRLRCWAVTELNECIYVWHDLKQRDPLWPVPDAVHEVGDPGGGRYFRPVGPEERHFFGGVPVHPQVVVESSVDRQHYRFVHHVPTSPTVLAATSNQSSWHATIGLDGSDAVEIFWYGVGLSFTSQHHGDGVEVVSVCPTPVDDTTTDIFATYWISDDADYEDRLRAAKQMLPDDIAIWAHQRYLDHPAVSASEAGEFARLREWARRFYPRPRPDLRSVTV